jgi:hypothetical protein
LRNRALAKLANRRVAPVDRFPEFIKPLGMLAPDHLHRHTHAFIADKSNRTGNEAADVALTLAAE